MIIGLHGKARSGKDTACDYLLAWAVERGLTARRDAFADRLKLSAAAAIGLDKNASGQEEILRRVNVFKEQGVLTVSYSDGNVGTISGREYLQRYGTEAHRDVFAYDFWVDAVLPVKRAVLDDASRGDVYTPAEDVDILIVTDVRFDNEAQRIRDLGGEIWQILRPGNTTIEEDAHASERPLPAELVDQVFVNDRDLEHLRGLVTTALERKASWQLTL